MQQPEDILDFASFLIEKGANLEEAITTIKTYQRVLENENIIPKIFISLRS